MIRALIFDCFGVLYRDNFNMLYELIPLEKRQELQDIIHACDHGTISRRDYFEAVAEISGKSVEEIKAVSSRQFSRNEALIEYIKPLRADYKIGLLSNIGDEVMDTLFPEPERSQLFDGFVLSSQVGIIKPAREIFEIAATQLGVLPEECIMIDDIPRNIEGAQLAGMQGIVYGTNRELQIQLSELLKVSHA